MTTTPTPKHRPRIVVGVDGSNDANVALEWAAAEAVLRGADLWVVHVWSLPHALAPNVARMPVDKVEYERHAAELLDATVEGVLAGVESRPDVVESVLVQGHAAGALADAADGADLVVVGARGRGGFAGLRLGSISQQLAQHSPCPLVIVQAPDV